MSPDLSHEAEACRRLWLVAAAVAVSDAAKAVVQSKLDRADAVDAQMRYFRSQNWREVSALAGVTHRPEAIEQMLLSDKAKPTAALMRRAYGLIEGEA